MVAVVEPVAAAEARCSAALAGGTRRWHLWFQLRHVLASPAVRIGGGIWLATRVAYVLVTYVAVIFTQAGTVRNGGDALAHHVYSPHFLAWEWVEWDAWQSYLPIALHGYVTANQANFFPLYPLLVRALLPLVGGPVHVLRAALLVSQGASLLAFVGLAALVLGMGGSARLATLTVSILVASPLAFFLAAPYPSSLLLALAVGMWLAAQRGWWLVAALCVALATLTHPTGAALWLPLFIAYGRERWWGHGRVRWALALLWQLAGWYEVGRRILAHAWRIVEAESVMLAGPLALAGYMIWCQSRFGDRFAFLHSQEHFFGHQRLAPWAALRVDVSAIVTAPGWTYLQARVLVDAVPIAVALIIVAVCAVWRAERWPLNWILYVLGLVAMCLAMPVTGTLFPDPMLSAGRYLVPAFPLSVALARWAQRRPALEMLLVGGGFALQAVLLAFYLNGGWLV